MKKQMRRLQLHRETLRQLDPPLLRCADGGGTATVCTLGCPLTAPPVTGEHHGPGGTKQL